MIAHGMPKAAKPVALMDGDVIAYKAAAAANAEDQTEKFARMLVDKITDAWLKAACASSLVMCLSTGTNFRKEAYPEYKANRDPSDRPPLLALCRDYLRFKYEVEEQDGLEADDIMGQLATSGEYDYPVITTIDKDLQQIPGWHCNPDKFMFPFYVTETDAWHLEYAQWAAGDSTDGFKGLKGVGVKTALKAIRRASCPAEAELLVRAMYTKAGYDMEYCEQMRVCSKILRTDNR
jgi:5'-3' exonuclease